MVYAEFRFSDGSSSDSLEAVSDDIILDTRALIDSVYFMPGDIVFSQGDSVVFYLATNEPEGYAWISFGTIQNLPLSYNPTESNNALQFHVYSGRFAIPGGFDIINGLVTGRFIDAAGNEALEVHASELINIANPPIPVTVSVTAESASSIRLNWSESVDSDFAAYHIHRGRDRNFSDNLPPVSIISSGSTVSYVDTGLAANTYYFYRIYVYDRSGLSAASNIDSARTLSGTVFYPEKTMGRMEGNTGPMDSSYAGEHFYRTCIAGRFGDRIFSDWIMLSVS